MMNELLPLSTGRKRGPKPSLVKSFLLLGGFLLFGTVAFADPCLPGSLQDYINLGATGCSLNNAQLFNFETAPDQTFATPIAPSLVQITPGGGPSTATLLLTLNSSATAGDLFESFFRFNVSGDLVGASISLGSPAATGDGAVIGVLDVCAGGSFLGIVPIGCSASADTRIVFAIDGDSLLSDSMAFPVSSFFDVFADITIDGGLSGAATLDSASVSIDSKAVTAAVPEPSSLLLMTAVLGGLALIEGCRQRRS